MREKARDRTRRDIHQMALLILDDLLPDCLPVLDEPDTQSKNTGLDLTIENFRDLLSHEGAFAERLGRPFRGRRFSRVGDG